MPIILIVIFNSQFAFRIDGSVAYYDDIFNVIKISPELINTSDYSYADVALHEYAHYVWDNFDEDTKASFIPYIKNQSYKLSMFSVIDKKDKINSERFAMQVMESCYYRNYGLEDISDISKYPDWENIAKTYFNRLC